MKAYFSLSFTALVALVAGVLAAPKPAAVQKPSEWTLDVIFEHPQQIMVRTPGSNTPARFWYMIITLVNSTGRDVEFYPKCELMTDKFELIPAGTEYGRKVFNRIKLRHEGRYPFLESLEHVDNKLLQGQDNAKDIAVIWPDFDPNSKEVTIFLAGLSNETAAIEHPTAKDKNGKPLRILLQKTLELKYKIGGDPIHRDEQQMAFQAKSWVMR